MAEKERQRKMQEHTERLTNVDWSAPGAIARELEYARRLQTELESMNEAQIRPLKTIQ